MLEIRNTGDGKIAVDLLSGHSTDNMHLCHRCSIWDRIDVLIIMIIVEVDITEVLEDTMAQVAVVRFMERNLTPLQTPDEPANGEVNLPHLKIKFVVE